MSLTDLSKLYFRNAVAYRKAGMFDLAVEHFRISKACAKAGYIPPRSY